MKRRIYVGMLALLLLAGCSDEAEPVVSAEANAETTIPAYFDGSVVSPQVTDDRTVQKVGQSFRDLRGGIELKAVNTEIPASEIGGIEVTIHEAKILHLQPEYSMIDFFHSYTHETEFDMAKYFVEFTNTTDEVLKFAPAAIIETDSGAIKTWEDELYLEELNGDIQPGETKRGNIGFILDEPGVESLTLTTSDVFSAEDDKLADAQEIQIEF